MSYEASLPKEKCRSCGSENLVDILTLGVQYISDFYDSAEHEKDAMPLHLILCDPKKDGCGLLQLRHTAPRERLYRQYWYRSGINQTMRNALADITSKVESLTSLKQGDLVIDIGSNDSTLLRSYQTPDLELVGFEPSKNLMEYAKLEKGNVINDFFSYESLKKIYGDKKAKVITSIAMFYDLDDPNIFVQGIKNCLAQDGIWIIQMNYLVSMLEQNAFDNIGHEHLEYYSLYALEHLLSKHGLEVFDIELNNINGGSFRTYIRNAGANTKSLPGSENRLKEVRQKESDLGLDELKIYEDFSARVNRLKDRTYNFIKEETQKGKTVYLYGASTRGNTLLQYYNLDNKFIKAAAERNPDKWGKFTVGTSIPIISEEQARKEKPDYFLVLPWAFVKEFVKRESEYLKNGGKFIVPLPEFEIIEYNGMA